MKRAGATAVCALALLLGGTSGASAEPTAPLGQEGRWITDAGGRVAILHGVNMVYKRPPYHPAAAGFGEDDAAFLRSLGFNTVRLGLIYAAVEPQPGVYDDAYLDEIEATEEVLADAGIFSQLDFHQDLYNERFQGEGWPDWAVQDDGLPAEPKLGFPANYPAMPALNRAFDHFWANDPGPGGVGLQDRYAAAFRHVAQQFIGDRHTLGYDLMNEPWPGSVWPTCGHPVGCPLFDTMTLAPFHDRVIDAIRQVEGQKIIWYEPNVIFNFGADSWHPATGDGQTGFSFHVYCLAGAFAIPGLPALACETADALVFDNASKQAQETGDALLLSEFGATDDLGVIGRNIDSADEHRLSWQYWHYCACDDPTTQGPGATQAIVVDANEPPTGDNLKQAKIDLLVRPYPQATTGTPTSFVFDEATKRFDFEFSTARADGEGAFEPTAVAPGVVDRDSPRTEVFVPVSDYPGGYDVDVDGAAIASAPGAELLELIACSGVTDVAVTVLPSGEGTGNGADCALTPPRISLNVAPSQAKVNQRECFDFQAHVADVPAEGAKLRFGHKERTTDADGEAQICRRFDSTGPRFAKVTKTGHIKGVTTINIRHRLHNTGGVG